ncbi:GPR1/FUN34/yaaH family-domain-containing protein [Infundibulicybe gibba]|nr:GPR1/FUN34/yaaH family-domain-containing protein [Infundibulicybe gibba]
MSNTSRDEEKGLQTFDPRSADPVSYSSRPTRIANPGPAGLFMFASTTFILSMFNVNTRGVHTPNVIVGMAIFGGGLVQLLAGMWEFPRGNVFGATAFSSYGVFWMSYATIFIPSSGIISAYSDPQELSNAIGIYLITWFMVTVMFILPVIRRHLAFTVLLSCLAVALLCLRLPSLRPTHAGGVFGVMTGLIAYYIGVSEMLSAEESAFMRVPLGIRAR